MSDQDPEDKARALLRQMLTENQRVDLDQNGGFHVEGSEGGHYKIRVGRAGNVLRLGDTNEPVETLCAHPEDPEIPTADTMLAQFLLLRIDEPAFLAVANSRRWGSPSTLFEGRPLIPAELPTDGSPVLPEMPDRSGMARLRVIKQAFMTAEGREMLAAALVARIRYGSQGTEEVIQEVAQEVTQLTQVILSRTEGEPTEYVGMLSRWMETGECP